jgi:hypothetical protein
MKLIIAPVSLEARFGGARTGSACLNLVELGAVDAARVNEPAVVSDNPLTATIRLR